MNKLTQVAMLVATAALATTASAETPSTLDNWRNVDGIVWKNVNSELCWRDANWTPATAVSDCDGAIAGPVADANPIVVPKVATPPAPIATPPSLPPEPVAAAKVTFAADAFFDFDKAVLKPAGKAKLDNLVTKIKDINLEVIIAVGHTDSVGSDAYNQKLSMRRSETVKAYLVSKGVEKNRVYAEGKGEKQPVAENKTATGRAKNRRVEIEVVGTRTK